MNDQARSGYDLRAMANAVVEMRNRIGDMADVLDPERDCPPYPDTRDGQIVRHLDTAVRALGRAGYYMGAHA